jgi:hypothetical protein
VRTCVKALAHFLHATTRPEKLFRNSSIQHGPVHEVPGTTFMSVHMVEGYFPLRWSK